MTFSARLPAPRIAPLHPEERTTAQQAILAKLPDHNIFTTLVRHLEAYRRWGPLAQFLLSGSSLPARDREIVMLRMGWLCQSEYEWAQHARIARAEAELINADLHRIAEGPAADGWSAFDRTLLQMIDELRYEAMISDATWEQLTTRYSVQQIMEAIVTAGNYQLVSMALNSLGVQLDPVLPDRLPTDLPLPRPADRPTGPRLSQPRVAPLSPDEWSQEQRELIAPQIRSNGMVLNLHATMIRNPHLYRPRVRFGAYLKRESLLSEQTRELLIMRSAWLTRVDYEWAHHVNSAREAGLSMTQIDRIAAGSGSAGWNEEQAATLRAADELRREAFISDETWETLSRHHDARQLIDVIFTVGGYTMTGLVINSFGIQLEPGVA
jgi:4-carboxymuconolactone decarboxylase